MGNAIERDISASWTPGVQQTGMIQQSGGPGVQQQSALIEQWVSRVVSFSSQFDDTNWSAFCVIGPPRVYPLYGDLSGAWAQKQKDANQFIEVEFPQKIFIEKIDIFETYHAGAVKRILAKHPDQSWFTVWSTPVVSDINSSRIFSPGFQKLSFECNVLRIEVDCTASKGWVEIDAVKISGTACPNQIVQPVHQIPVKIGPVQNQNHVEQWVARVINYSSQYDFQGYAASSVVGTPTVYPKYGDIPGAWAPRNVDACQFLEVEYAEKIFIQKIEIYETFHPGGVKTVKARRPNGEWCTVWQTDKVFAQTSSRIFSPEFQKLPFSCNVLRIEVDCTAANTWVEIDAVKIIGTKFNFEIPPPAADITCDLAQLVNNPLFSDIKFIVRGTPFHAHKALLYARSAYFRTMFDLNNANKMKAGGPTMFFDETPAPPLPVKGQNGVTYSPGNPPVNMPPPPSYDSLSQPAAVFSPSQVPPPAQYQPNQQTIQLNDVDPHSFAVVLHYLYTNSIPPVCQSLLLPSVWRAADRFSMEGLKSLVLFELSSALTVDNVINIYVDVISSSPILENLRRICEAFIQNNAAEVVKHRSFMNLPQNHIVEITQMMMAAVQIK